MVLAQSVQFTDSSFYFHPPLTILIHLDFIVLPFQFRVKRSLVGKWLQCVPFGHISRFHTMLQSFQSYFALPGKNCSTFQFHIKRLIRKNSYAFLFSSREQISHTVSLISVSFCVSLLQTVYLFPFNFKQQKCHK